MTEHKRSRMIGRLFQDPNSGTAPHMTIEENLRWLSSLSKGKAPFSRISKKDQSLFRERLSLLDMGLEDRMTQPVGLLSGGTAPGTDTSHGDDCYTETASSG